MRALLSATGLSVLILSTLIYGPAVAGRNAAGSMVLHVDNSISYSIGTDYCSEPPLPSRCEDLVTNVTRDPGTESIIWMVAAFPSNTSPGVTAFQVGITGSVPANDFTAHSPCGPGVLEIPDPNWPAPNTGTACAFNVPVYSRLFKMYWFAVTAPGVGSEIATRSYVSGDPYAEWADDSYPPRIDLCSAFGRVVWGAEGENRCPGTVHVGACCYVDGHCEVHDLSDCDALYLGDDIGCDPNPCPPAQGACCLQDGTCDLFMQPECESLGGQWQGAGTDCRFPWCSTAACCFADGRCEVLTQWGCDQQGGSYVGNGFGCTPDPCTFGACCFLDGRCTFLAQVECQALDGSFQGAGTVCDPNPCVQPGACCYPDGYCEVVSQNFCQGQGGSFQGSGTSCEPNTCTLGACCFTDGSCVVTTEHACADQHGTYRGYGTTCAPNPCQPTPTKATTWGRIKAGFRRAGE